MIDNKIYFADKIHDFKTLLFDGDFSSIFILTDTNCEKFCLPLFYKKFPEININQVIVLPFGEENKNILSLEKVWAAMINEADRHSLLINLGGGVITDMGGFAAAVFKRGIQFVNIPTSLLAMVDAAVGMKTGVNFMGGKNQIGLFSPPYASYFDEEFLNTLPARELYSGFAEMVKIAAISNAELFCQLTEIELVDSNMDAYLIRESIKSKLQIVASDPYEKAERKLLNFGHTIGHGLESFALSREREPISHGNAVALGILVESFIAKEMRQLGAHDFEQIENLIGKHFPFYPINEADFDEIISNMKWDKKNVKGKISFTFAVGIGDGSWDNFPTIELIKKALNYYKSKG